MKISKLLPLSLCLAVMAVLTGCSEARYAAHVVKQIPLPGDHKENIGYFKVGSSYKIKGRRYQPKETYNKTETGMASWYGPGFHGKMTANGEIFDENELTAAHRTLQMPSIIRVTNLSNGRTAIFRVNDRGPFAHDRILDVSKRGAQVLGFKDKGTTKIRLEVMGDASKEVAHRAKSGLSTKGYEDALAKQGNAPQPRAMARNAVVESRTQRSPVTEVSLSPADGSAPAAPLRKPAPVEGRCLNAPPKPPVLGTGRIYVQAGAFSNEQNALKFSSKMQSYGNSKVYLARANNNAIYRVRLGPFDDRSQAANIMSQLQNTGNNNAIIVSD